MSTPIRWSDYGMGNPTAEGEMKIERILERGIEDLKTGEVYLVQGDNGRYLVDHLSGHIRCNCPFVGDGCTHIRAVLKHCREQLEESNKLIQKT